MAREDDLKDCLTVMDKYGIYDLNVVFDFLGDRELYYAQDIHKDKKIVDKSRQIKAKRFIKVYQELNERDDTQSLITKYKLLAPDNEREILMNIAPESKINDDNLIKMQEEVIKEISERLNS